MAPPSPPVRVTRARAAAALAKDAAKTAPISAASSRVTKPKNKKDQPAASVKAAAAKRRATAKPKAARGSTATNATESSLAKSRRPGDRKRKAPAGAAADDADDLSLSEEDRPAKKQRGQAAKATKPESQQEPNSISNTGSEASSSAHTASSSSAPVTATSPSAATTIPAVDSDPRVTRARSTRPAALAARTALKQQASTRSRQSVASGASASANAEKSDKKTKSSRPARNIITTTYGTTPTPGLRSAVSRPLQNASQNPKKTVTFEEPANEDNLAGMPAKAVHNSDISDISDISDSSDDSDDSDGAAGPSTQAAVAVKNEKKVLSPLGPQKDGWIRPFSQDNGSDDELATAEKTPLKSPRQQLKDELLLTEKRQEDVSPYLAASSSVLSNAPRRLPMSPFKDAFKSPAKRVEGVSPFLTSSIEPKGTEPSSAPSLLQSPAKRPRMPLSVLSQANNEVAESYKVSSLKSPAKHPSQLMKKAGDEDIESPISKAPFPGPLFTKEPIAELQKKPTPKEREVPDHEDITPERSMDEAAKTLQQSTAPVEDAKKENADVSTTQINDQQMINDQPGTGKLEAPVVDAREQITSEQAPLVNHEPEHNKPEIEESEASDLDVEEQSVLTSTAENDQQIDDQLATGEANASVLGAEEQLMIPTIKDDQQIDDQLTTGEANASVLGAEEQLMIPTIKDDQQIDDQLATGEANASVLGAEEQLMIPTVKDDQQIDDQLATGEANASVLGAEEQLMIPTIKDDQIDDQLATGEADASVLGAEEQLMIPTVKDDQQIDDQLVTGEANASVLGAEEQPMIPTIKDDQIDDQLATGEADASVLGAEEQLMVPTVKDDQQIDDQLVTGEANASVLGAEQESEASVLDAEEQLMIPTIEDDQQMIDDQLKAYEAEALAFDAKEKLLTETGVEQRGVKRNSDSISEDDSKDEASTGENAAPLRPSPSGSSPPTSRVITPYMRRVAQRAILSVSRPGTYVIKTHKLPRLDIDDDIAAVRDARRSSKYLYGSSSDDDSPPPDSPPRQSPPRESPPRQSPPHESPPRDTVPAADAPYSFKCSFPLSPDVQAILDYCTNPANLPPRPQATPSAEQSPDAEQPIEQDAMDVDQVAGENFGHDAMDVDQVAGENFGHDAMDVDQGAGENVGHNAMDVDLAHDDIAVADHLGPRTPDAMEQDSAETYHHNAEHVHSRLSTIPEGVEEDDEEQVQREKREEQNKQASPVETAQVAHPDLPSTPQGLRHPRARRGGPQAHTAPTARAPVLSLQDKIQRERDDPTPFNLPFSHLPPSMGSPETRAALEAFVDAQIEADWARNRYEYTEQDAIRDWMAMGNPDPRIENNYRDPRNREPRVESYHEANEQESRIESRNREPPVEGYHEANEQEPRAEHGQADKESDAEDTTGLYDPDNKHPGTFRLSSEPESDSGSSSDKDAAKLSLSVDYVTQNSNTASTASRERAGDDDDDAPRDVQRQQIGGGRNPRNPTLLSGAVVYVEVHASDGEDVSRHFVELLTEMGAHCVEAWPWTPTRSAEGVLNSADIGITHVIFKDGSKETVDKIVQANGFVHCVGVGWVLDCEKENRWLKEYTYQVEVVLSALLAEGYRIAERRRAAAAANNAMATPSQNSVSDPAPQAVPAGNIDRRQSTVWERSPSEPGDADAPGLEPGPGPEPGSGPAPAPAGAGWGPAALTPALNTPAPETIARFAMDISPGTPSTASPGSPPEANQQQLMQTAPPRPIEAMPIGQSLVERAPNETIQMRLLEARRQTLQHAPKVTSPLKKQWSATDSI